MGEKAFIAWKALCQNQQAVGVTADADLYPWSIGLYFFTSREGADLTVAGVKNNCIAGSR